MNMTELRSLARERNLRGYSRLRKAELINLLRENLRVSPNATWDPQARSAGAVQGTGRSPLGQQTEQPLTKRQLKHRRSF